MEEHPISREEYVHKLLEAYRRTPGTTGRVRRADRLLAVQLYQRDVPLNTIENALVVAAARRLLPALRCWLPCAPWLTSCR